MKLIIGHEFPAQLGEWDEATHGYPRSPFGRIESALLERGVTPQQAVRSNELQPLAQVGDYHYSGGAFKIIVPDEFWVSK